MSKSNIKKGIGLGVGIGIGKRIGSHTAKPNSLDQKFIGQMGQIFLMPFYRIPKYAICLEHEEKDTQNLLWDIIGMLFLISALGALGWYPLMATIGGYFILAIAIGIVRKSLRRERLSEPEIDKEYAEKLNDNGYFKYDPPTEVATIEPIKTRVESEFTKSKKEREAKKTTTKTAIPSNITPDFDENDFESWKIWIQEHPDQIRAQKRQ